MRILIVDTCYERFLARHYAARPGLARESYASQWRALMDTFFGTADSYSHFLAQLGHEAHEIVVNCGPLQHAWAREHGYTRGLRRRLARPGRDSIVLAQAAEYVPDIVYVQNPGVLLPRTLQRLGHGRVLVGQIASELPADQQLRPFDLILTSMPHLVRRLRSMGIESEYFRIGFDQRVLEQLEPRSRDVDVSFVGNLGMRQHQRGNALLESAAGRVAIDFWGTGVDERSPSSPLRLHYRGEAWGLEMFELLARSRIALNRHIDVAENYANNMRLYEATGVGALLLTDAKANLHELFAPGFEVVTYEDADELVDRALYFIVHEDERRAIARAGQERTLRDHTYSSRMKELASLLGRYSGQRHG